MTAPAASRAHKERFLRSYSRKNERLNQFTDDAIDEAISELVLWERLRIKINRENRAIYAANLASKAA